MSLCTDEINSNVKYNLLMASFPFGTVEGQFGLPKGRMDSIDCGNPTNTKIREFIEETRYVHPSMLKIATHHYQDPNYISPFTDKNYRVVEEWEGLNNCVYWVEYTVFFIKSMDELIHLGSGPETRDFILNNIPSVANASDRVKRGFKEKFHYVSHVDDKKRPVILALNDALFRLNSHRIQQFKSVTEMDIFNAFKKYQSDQKIL